jgi:hypothetical protein
MRSAEDVIVDMLKKQSTVTGISEFKIGERGNRVLTGFADIFRDAGGGEAGEKAVRDTFAKGRKDISEAEVDKRFKERMAAEDKQLAVAMQELRSTVGVQLVPKLREAVPVFSQMIPIVSKPLDRLIKLGDFAAKNPIAGLGTLIMGYFVKELAAAQVAKTIQSMLAGSMPSGAGAVAGGAGGAAGAIGAGVLMQGAILGHYGSEMLGARSRGAQRGDHLAADIAGGEKGAAAKAALAQLRGEATTGKKVTARGDLLTRAGTAVANPMGAVGQLAGDAAARALGGKASIDTSTGTIESGAALDKLAKALAEHGAKLDRNANATEQNTKASGAGPKPLSVADPKHPTRNPNVL